jgi:hypothetical protein
VRPFIFFSVLFVLFFVLLFHHHCRSPPTCLVIRCFCRCRDIQQSNCDTQLYFRLTNTDDVIAQRLDDRLRNSSFSNIGTTCMNDAPPISTQDPYVCGEGDKNFHVPLDAEDYNHNARCSECFAKALQVFIYALIMSDSTCLYQSLDMSNRFIWTATNANHEIRHCGSSPMID